jgi:hypothetical protein
VNTILLGTYVVLVLSTTFKGIPFNQWQQTFIQDPSILFQGWNAYLILKALIFFVIFFLVSMTLSVLINGGFLRCLWLYLSKQEACTFSEFWNESSKAFFPLFKLYLVFFSILIFVFLILDIIGSGIGLVLNMVLENYLGKMMMLFLDGMVELLLFIPFMVLALNFWTSLKVYFVKQSPRILDAFRETWLRFRANHWRIFWSGVWLMLIFLIVGIVMDIILKIFSFLPIVGIIFSVALLGLQLLISAFWWGYFPSTIAVLLQELETTSP